MTSEDVFVAVFFSGWVILGVVMITRREERARRVAQARSELGLTEGGRVERLLAGVASPTSQLVGGLVLLIVGLFGVLRVLLG